MMESESAAGLTGSGAGLAFRAVIDIKRRKTRRIFLVIRGSLELPQVRQLTEM